MASQLLWDIQQNADTLVDDFSRGLFGRAAALDAGLLPLRGTTMSSPSAPTTRPPTTLSKPTTPACSAYAVVVAVPRPWVTDNPCAANLLSHR